MRALICCRMPSPTAAVICGIAAAAALTQGFGVSVEPWFAAGDAVLRAACVAGLLALLRWVYARIRKREGIGLGDVKLAAAVGAWLPLDVVPLCLASRQAARW